MNSRYWPPTSNQVVGAVLWFIFVAPVVTLVGIHKAKKNPIGR